MSKELWRPSTERVDSSQMMAFMHRYAPAEVNDWPSLYRWSIDDSNSFWGSLWEYADIKVSVGPSAVIEDGDKLQGARWFPGVRFNFAENLLRHRGSQLAIVSQLENGDRTELSYAELYLRVAQLAASLRAEGVGVGDVVAGYMPNIAETVVAMLATTSIGAIWSSCSPDFGINGVLDRFVQISPKVVVSTDGYFYNGKAIPTLPKLAEIVEGIDSVNRVVIVPVVQESPDISVIPNGILLRDYADSAATEIQFEQLPFDHPLYILYSSGTTGVPKCIVHGAGGTLLQHIKEHKLHVDITREDVLFYFTTCGWMVWNWLVSGLVTGCTLALYDGSPFADDGDVLLNMIDRIGITVFGTGAKYIAALEKLGKKPAQTHDLSTVKTILSTGSPLAEQAYEYIYRDFKSDVCLASISGGTDILACFVCGNPFLPVCAGEMHGMGLGMAVEFWNEDGEAVIGEKGELICKSPFPSTPVKFWNDPDGSLYHNAYFSRWPNIWAHGDFGEITINGGVVIHGRSDAVLNPGGVRIGTAEIYRQVDRLDEIAESVVVGQQWQDDVRVVLFVVMAEGLNLDDDLRAKIRSAVRANTTPRHVPAKILQVSDIPRTLTGKIVEIAVRDTIHGKEVANKDSLLNPEALEEFRNIAELTV